MEQPLDRRTDCPHSENMQFLIACSTLLPMHKRFRVAVALTAVSGQLVFSACRNSSLSVNLPPGYSGEVEINCGSNIENANPIDVGYTGRVEDAVCPHHEMDLRIMRDEKSVEPTGNVI